MHLARHLTRRLLKKRLISTIKHLIKISSWKNNGVLNIVELSDGHIKSFPITSLSLSDIQSGKRNDILSIEDQEDLLEIEQTSYGDDASSLKSMLKTLMTKNGIQILFRNNGKLVGYTFSIPADRFYIHMMHSDYAFSYDNLYLYSTAGKIDAFKIIRIFRKGVANISYRKVLSYCINPKVAKAQKLFGFQTKAVIPNWVAGLDAEYMELEIRKSSQQ